MQFLFGILLAVVIAGAAWRAHALNRSGAVAAAVLGTIIFGLGGFSWAVLLLGFFISSSFFSRLFKKHKANFGEKYSKGSERDAGQVLANGGVAGLLVLFSLFFPDTDWIWFAFAASLAAVNADTWATELGTLSPTLPRLITTFHPVEKGTSGAVSTVGTLFAAAGSLWIAGLAALPWQSPAINHSPEFILPRLLLITIAGIGGSLVDSLLGATIQAIYHCPVCNKETERHPFHACGTPTVLARGWRWLNNDWVNAFCGLSAAMIAALLIWFVPQWFGL